MAVTLYQQGGKGKTRRYQKVNLGRGRRRPISPVPTSCGTRSPTAPVHGSGWRRPRLKNTGDHEGAEIVELYVGDAHAGVPRPVKELKGFARVNLKPQETRRVFIALDRRSFAFYDVSRKDWNAEESDYSVDWEFIRRHPVKRKLHQGAPTKITSFLCLTGLSSLKTIKQGVRTWQRIR